jgi:hypothetical protein
MRPWLIGLAAAFVLWCGYSIGPYWALYRLGTAIQAHDVAAISERVNFRAVRISVARQLVDAYLQTTGKPKGETSSLEVGLGTSLVDPLLEEFVTPDALAKLLNGSGDSRLAGAPTGPLFGSEASLFSEPLKALRSAWQLFITSDARGFRVLTFYAPLGKPKAEQFGLSFRFRPVEWRVTALQLPAATVQRLVQEMARKNQAARAQ